MKFHFKLHFVFFLFSFHFINSYFICSISYFNLSNSSISFTSSSFHYLHFPYSFLIYTSCTFFYHIFIVVSKILEKAIWWSRSINYRSFLWRICTISSLSINGRNCFTSCMLWNRNLGRIWNTELCKILILIIIIG